MMMISCPGQPELQISCGRRAVGQLLFWTYPVYQDFEDTISLLKEQGAYKEHEEDYTFGCRPGGPVSA